MKKTANGKRNKLTLNLETVRTLTSQDLTLVVGGACKHGTTNSSVPPPDEKAAAIVIERGQTTC